MANKYANLFSPLKVGGVTLKNRIAMMPMGVFSPRLLNLKTAAYTKDGADYYIERAKGGTGLIVTGIIPVTLPHLSPLARPDGFVGEMRYLMDGVHEYGAKIFVQLTAMNGRAAHADSAEALGLTPAPAPIQNVWDPTMENRGVTRDEIRQYVMSFAEAAWLVKRAGGDGVEIHAVHEGYLLDQFAIASLNRRTDEYGGSLENRLRLAAEIAQAVKAKCGASFPVSLRYSVRSYTKGFNRGALPGEEFEEFGRDLPESRVAARMLQDAGYDLLDCDNGNYDAWYWAHPPVYMPKACNLADVAEIKKAVDIPVACAGRFDDPGLAEAAIADGRIDMMGMGRPLLADPELPNKFASGDLGAIRPCISCHQGCLGRIFQRKDISCAVNPACGREKSWALAPAAAKKRVAVVGGGLGGMEAARVCALRGHSVDLYEKAGALGGVFIAASAPDFKDDDKKLLAWYVRQMRELGVAVHLNREATKGMLAELGYDELFVATGATERRLAIPGLEGDAVSYAVDALLSPQRIKGDRVLIVGGGLTGCEIAYMLGRAGKSVTIVEMAETILNAFGLAAANYNMLMEILDYYKVNVIKSATVESYADGKATVAVTAKNYPNAANRARRLYAVGPQGITSTREIAADHVVICAGYASDSRLYCEMQGEHGEQWDRGERWEHGERKGQAENGERGEHGKQAAHTHLVGDAARPATVMDAIWAAYEIAKDA
jgi:2-enoate reductase